MIVGLTGGIGSGKSIVAKLFSIFGCAVFNSDMAAKNVYFKREVKDKVTELLGKQAYINDYEIDRNYISSKIFSNTDLLHQLNKIIHPEVKKNFDDFVEYNKGKLIIKETAILFETKLNLQMDKTIIVVANEELRIQRVMQRDGITYEQVMSKIKNQLPQEEKMKLADFVIKNNEEEFLITQSLNIYNQLIQSA